MKKFLGWLTGTLTARITGAEPENFLNICARTGFPLGRMAWVEPFVLEVQVPARWRGDLHAVAEQAQCRVEGEVFRGLPFFLQRFRGRYALLAGLVLTLAFCLVGSRFILTVDVTGNETITDREIISQLRLCGVSQGTWGPGVNIREVENRMMLAMNELTYFSLNLFGTRAEVIVREAQPGPTLRDEKTPADVVAGAEGIITHIEPWNGDARFQVGDTVGKGDVLISGEMRMDLHPMVWEGDAGTRLVHAEGKVLARTWRTLTASLDLNAPGKTYTGEVSHRYALSVWGRRMNFYQNSGIPYDRCDIITRLESWTPLEGRMLPILWEKTTYQAYTLTTASMDPARAEAMLKEELMENLEGIMKEGEVLTAEYETERQGDTLTVTLLAQCSEEIGRTVQMDTDQMVRPPKSPLEDMVREEEKNTKEQSP